MKTTHCLYSVPANTIEKALIKRESVMTTPFLRRLYREWYDQFKAEIKSLPQGTKIELGAGKSFFREVAPSVLSTDRVQYPNNDLTFLPSSMPFNADSVSGIFMIDHFGEIADTRAFLTEAQRVLKPGGKIFMIEPTYTIWGRLAHRWFGKRTFDRSANWACTCSGNNDQVNNAMAWIVFERDFYQFRNDFPSLSVVNITYHTPLGYFLGGGNRLGRGLVPHSYPIVKRVDSWLSKISPHWSMFMTIEVEKR